MLAFTLFLVKAARRLQGEPRRDCAGSEAEENRRVVEVAAVACLHCQAALVRTPACTRAICTAPVAKEHGDRDEFGARSRLCHGAVAEQENGRPAAHQFDGAGAQIIDGLAQIAGKPEDAVQNRQRHLVGQRACSRLRRACIWPRERKGDSRESPGIRALVLSMCGQGPRRVCS